MRHQGLRSILLCSCAFANLLWAQAGLAQSEKVQLAVEEIIVTARKTAESIQDVSFSMQAFSEQAIEERGMRNLEDVAQFTPGFTFEGFSTGLSGNPVVRGITNTFTTARIQNVSVFLNGIYLQRQSMINLGLLDMERIEVLKGPQSALFGRNAFSGAINYIAKEPSNDLEGNIAVTLGSDEREDYKFNISGALIDDVLLAKVSFGSSKYDGHTDNDHPFKDANPSGFNTRGKLGGWDDKTWSAGLRFYPFYELEIALDYYKSNIKKEVQPFYTLRGAASSAYGFGGFPGDLNCNTQTVTTPTTGVGPTVWCGQLPATRPQTTQGDFFVDPRSVGAEAKTDIVSFRVDYEINDDWNVSYLFGLTNHSAGNNGGVSDGGVDPGDTAVVGVTPPFTLETVQYSTFNGAPNTNLDSKSHEVRFEWGGNERFSGSFGLFYSTVEDEEWAQFNYMEPCNINNEAACYLNTGINAPTPLANADPNFLISSFTYLQLIQTNRRSTWIEFEDEIFGIFGDFAWFINDEFTLRAEARYSEEDKEATFRSDTFGLLPGEVIEIPYTGSGSPPFFVDYRQESAVFQPEQQRNFYFFTPRVTVEWEPTFNNLVYFMAAKGVKTGGFSNANDPTQQTYEAEENWTFELGSKNTFLDNTMQLNMAVYYVDWKDIQGNVAPLSGAFAIAPTANIGDATNLGFELDGLWNVTPNWSVDFGYAYNNPKFDDAIYSDAFRSWYCDDSVCPADGNVKGNRLQRTSKHQFFTGINYRTEFGDGWSLMARLDGNYLSSQYASPLNLAETDARTVYNANLNINSPKNWEFNAWVKNLADKEYISASFVVAQFNQYIVSQGARRSFGFTAKYKF